MVRRVASVFIGAIFIALMLSACGGSEEAEIKYSYFSMKTPVLSNIKDSTIIIKCEPVLEVKSEEALTSITEKTGVVRDVVGAVLRELTKDDLTEPAEVEANCKAMMKERLVEALGPLGEEISNIYFDGFVWQ